MAGTPHFTVGAGSAAVGCAACPKSSSALPGTRNVNLRAEIDTSPPFGSVKEAVTHFESSGAWIHLHKLGLGDGYMNNIGEIDIKRVEEQALELEKNLIVKELETLDVLEELGTTKRMVEDLKWQLQKEALKSMTPANPEDRYHQVMTPDIREINQRYITNNYQDRLVGSSSPCPMSSPDLILMELNQAKLNLGKTIDELGSIQTSVETLNKKIRKERALLEKTRHRLTLKSAPHPRADQEVSVFEDPTADVQEISMNEHPRNVAEMKLVAAKKMEEAARAAEAVAIAEIKALSGSECSFDYLLPEPDNAMFSKCQSPLFSKKTPKRTLGETFLQNDGANYFSRVAIMKKMEDAENEVKLSKQAMEEALQRMEIASRKQLDAGEALRRWNPNMRPNRSNPPEHIHSPLVNPIRRGAAANDQPEPVLRTTVSMRDILSRKQSLPDHHEDYAPTHRGGQNEGRKVALSQMLNELRDDIRLPTRSDGNSNTHPKQFMSQRKKFGFIHISLPLARPNRKSQQPGSGMR